MTGPSLRTSRLNVAMVLLGVMVVTAMIFERLVMLADAAPTDFDDAYMYLRYADHWLAGQGLVWNVGESRVFGVTSILHLVAVIVVRWIAPGLSAAAVLRVASGGAAMGFLAALVGVVVLGVGGQTPSRRRTWLLWAAILLPLLAYREDFTFHASMGMDTMLAAWANTVLLFFALQFAACTTRLYATLTALVAFLAVLARPDNALCGLLCPVLSVVLLGSRPWGRALSWFVLSFCGLVVTGLVVAWCWLGTPIPLAFFAKQPWYYGGFAGEFSWNPYYFLRVFLATALPFVLALIFFADRTDRRRALALLVPACLSMAVLFSFNQIMGHLGRFFFPFLPFFVAAGGLAARGWLVRRQQGLLPPGRTYFVRAALAGAVVLIGSNSLTLAGEGYAARAHEQILASLGGYHVPAPLSLPEVDSWQSAQIVAAIARSAPAGTSIAMSEHGLPSALAPNVAILDVLGLHDRNFAQHGFSASELFRRKPDAIWMPHPDHTQMLRDILDSDDFWREYVFYPDAFTYGFALRRTGPRFANLLALLTHAWSATYPGVPMAQHVAQRGE